MKDSVVTDDKITELKARGGNIDGELFRFHFLLNRANVVNKRPSKSGEAIKPHIVKTVTTDFEGKRLNTIAIIASIRWNWFHPILLQDYAPYIEGGLCKETKIEAPFSITKREAIQRWLHVSPHASHVCAFASKDKELRKQKG